MADGLRKRRLIPPAIAPGAVCAQCLKERQKGKGPSGSAYVTPNLGTHVEHDRLSPRTRQGISYGEGYYIRVLCRWHAVEREGCQLYTLAEWAEKRAAERVRLAIERMGK